jgi:site-specific recombinase XerD
LVIAILGMRSCILEQYKSREHLKKSSEKSTVTYLLNGGYDIRTVQELFGHKDVKTTMIYPHILKRGPAGVSNLVDGL